MNNISIGHFDLSVNKNENYSFSVRKREVLCLNKRVVEIGVGACVAFSTRIFFGSPTPESLLSYSAAGVVSVLTLGAYQELKFLSLVAVMIRQSIFYGIEDMSVIIATNILFPLALAGRVAFAVGGISALVIGVSFVIKEFGGRYMNKLLNDFNNWQNSLALLEIENNLNYKFTMLGRDILCLKNTVLFPGLALACVLANASIGLDYSVDGLLYPEVAIGTLTIFKIFGPKVYLVPLIAEFLGALNSSTYGISGYTLGYIALLTARTFMLAIIGFGTFALLSFLVKESGSEKLASLKRFLNSLEDKKKKMEYDKDLNNKRLMIERMRAEIRAANSCSTEMNTGSIEDLRSHSEAQLSIPRERIKREGKNLGASQSVSVAGKTAIEVPTQIEISGNNRNFIFQKLDGTACDKKNVWGVIISDSSNSERYQSFLNNGRIGQQASIRQLKGGGSTFEIGKGMDSRLIGLMYKPEDISNALKGLRQIKDEDVPSLVKAIKENCGKDTSLIIFSAESKKHQDISKTSRQLQ